MSNSTYNLYSQDFKVGYLYGVLELMMENDCDADEYFEKAKEICDDRGINLDYKILRYIGGIYAVDVRAVVYRGIKLIVVRDHEGKIEAVLGIDQEDELEIVNLPKDIKKEIQEIIKANPDRGDDDLFATLTKEKAKCGECNGELEDWCGEWDKPLTHCPNCETLAKEQNDKLLEFWRTAPESLKQLQNQIPECEECGSELVECGELVERCDCQDNYGYCECGNRRHKNDICSHGIADGVCCECKECHSELEDQDQLVCPHCDRNERECEEEAEGETNPITEWCGWGLSCDDCYYKNHPESEDEDEEEEECCKTCGLGFYDFGLMERGENWCKCDEKANRLYELLSKAENPKEVVLQAVNKILEKLEE